MSDVTTLMYVVLAASVLALSFAYYFYRWMLGKDEGTELMKTIASHVRKGALAYLKQQYKVVTIVFVVLAVVFAVMAYFKLQNGIVWFAFLTGGFFSGLAGFFGMKTATYASARTANALLNNDIKTVRDLVMLSETDLKDLKGFGSKALDEVKDKLAELNI